MQALLEDRIDEDYAGELLQELERASMSLRPTVGKRWGARIEPET
jgi:hypothetical protein